jgi:hypothetical protein
VIFADSLPRIKTFLRPARLTTASAALLVRLVAAFVSHRGRLSASQSATSESAACGPPTSAAGQAALQPG